MDMINRISDYIIMILVNYQSVGEVSKFAT